MSRHRCCENGNVNRGAWTKEEDEKLISYITSHDRVSWSSLPQAAGLVRCAKSCRLRWVNYLRPDLKRGDFTNEEDELIIGLHRLMGDKWSVIAERLPGRTVNEIKNHWNSDIKRKLRRRGLHHRSHGAGFGHEQNSTTGKGGREKFGFRNQTHPRGESSSSGLNLELELSPPCCKHPSLMLELTPPSCKHSSPTLELSPPCCKRPSRTLEFSPPCCKHTSPQLVTNRSFLRSKALKITEPEDK